MSDDNKQKKEKTSGWKRMLIEWGVIAAVAAVLYFTGLHTEVLGTLQRGILWTGIFDAEVHEVPTTDGPMLTDRAYGMSLTTPEGEHLSLADFKGKVLFVNIWASWCPPCVAEMPTIETLYNEVGDNKDIAFLLISLDEESEKAVSFMERKEFPMPYYFPGRGLPAVFQSPYIPSTYVISKEGQVIYKREGIADYSSAAFSEWLVDQVE